LDIFVLYHGPGIPCLFRAPVFREQKPIHDRPATSILSMRFGKGKVVRCRPEFLRAAIPKKVLAVLGLAVILGVAYFCLLTVAAGSSQLRNPVPGNTTAPGQDAILSLSPALHTPTPPGSPLSGTEGLVCRTYSWAYQGTEWSWTGEFSDAGYRDCRNRSHARENGYSGYALPEYDRQLLGGILRKFEEAGTRSGYTEYDTIMNIAAFVRSLPGTPAEVTAGYDDYPRYPLETLVDGGGDSEDTSLLTAALLNELGYGTVLLRFPGHMAVGVEGADTLPGTYFEYNGSRYYYLETTGIGGDLGEIPDEYADLPAEIFPLALVPALEMTCSTKPAGSDTGYSYYRVRCDIRNTGAGTARNASLYIAATAPGQGADRVWAPDSTVSLGDYPEGATGSGDATVRIPRNEVARTTCVLSGDNFRQVTLVSEPFRA